VIEVNPMGRRPLGRHKLRWEVGVKREVERMGYGTNWSDAAEYRDRWQSLSLAVWS